MIYNEMDVRHDTIMYAAALMMAAARTAPKAKGIDLLEMAVVTGHEKVRLTEAMRELSSEMNKPFFLRDANNVDEADAVLLLGTHRSTIGLDCGLCGIPTCKEKTDRFPELPCAFNMHDLGVAVGSAVASAAELRIDCRVMFSAGVAARRLALLPDCHAIFAIPLSCTGKNPFFDRK